jgi:glucan biosynthesis protein C
MPWRSIPPGISRAAVEIFFILAGYFVALLVVDRGYKGMLAHRLRRLALPFLVFWPVLIVCTTLLIAVYLHLMAYGTPGIDLSLFASKGKPASPFNTMHMWFIYYLIWFCILTVMLAQIMPLLPVKLLQVFDAGFRVLASNWWGPLILAVPLAIIGGSYRAGMLAPNGSFIPNLNELMHHGLFFLFGLYLYRHWALLFPPYRKTCWRNTIAGCIVFVLVLGALKSLVTSPHRIAHIETTIAFLYNLTGCGGAWP